MSFAVNLPLFLIIVCLVSAVVSALLPHRAARILSLCLTAASVAANVLVLLYVVKNGEVTYLMGHYSHPWGNELKLGIIESLFSAAFSAVFFLCLLGGRQEMERFVAPGKVRFFYVMADLVQVSLLVLAYTNDLFTGYVFIEICTIASCGLLMIRENGRTILASIRYMIFSLVGSGLFLFGVIFLYGITGQLLMPNLKEAIGALWASGEYHLPLLAGICFITIGIAIKSGLCPFHLWMADTYGAAVPVSSAILSGLVSKGYIFLLIKIILNVFSTDVFYACGIQNVLYLMGAAGIIIGSVSAMREDDIFRMVAYSSAAQIGYVYMGIGLAGGCGLTAALIHILAHAVTKPALFLAIGVLSAACGGARKFKNLQGAAHRDLFAGIAFACGAFSMIGLPLTAGFISKFLFGSAAFACGTLQMGLTLGVLAVSTILNTLYFARTVVRLFSRSGTAEDLLPLPVRRGGIAVYRTAAVILILLNLFIGIRTGYLTQLISAALSAV